MNVTVVILTMDEELHIERAIASVSTFARRCVVIDSGSTDGTAALATAAGAEVFVHPFVNQARQFNWALDQLGDETEWVLRLDADEIVTPELANEICNRLDGLSDEICGVSVDRRILFMGKPIRWGGVFPVNVVRLFRYGRGQSEDRWMDEHIVCDGAIVGNFSGEIWDINQKSLNWWIAKHNAYASREALEIINKKYDFLAIDNSVAPDRKKVSIKGWVRNNIYEKLPLGLRAFIYFIYRYVLRFGFLDGFEGTAFHLLQGFWYRYLVDLKVSEVESHMNNFKTGPLEAVVHKLEIPTLPYGGAKKRQ